MFTIVALVFMTSHAQPHTNIFLGSRFSAPVRSATAFQARYEETRRQTDSAAPPEMNSGHLYVDRDGRTRVDQDTDGLTLILDPIAKVVSLIAKPEARVIWQAPLGAFSPGSGPEVPSSPDRQDRGTGLAAPPPGVPASLEVQDLGTKSIDGVLCQGARFVRPGSDAENWVAKELGIVVWSRETRDGRETTYRIFDLQLVTPAPSTFEVPADGAGLKPRGVFARLGRLLGIRTRVTEIP